MHENRTLLTIIRVTSASAFVLSNRGLVGHQFKCNKATCWLFETNCFLSFALFASIIVFLRLSQPLNGTEITTTFILPFVFHLFSASFKWVIMTNKLIAKNKMKQSDPEFAAELGHRTKIHKD